MRRWIMILVLLFGLPGLAYATSFRTWIHRVDGKTYFCAAYGNTRVCVLARTTTAERRARHGRGRTVKGKRPMHVEGSRLVPEREIVASWCVGHSCARGEVVTQNAKETIVAFPTERRLPASAMRLLCWLEGIHPGVDGCP